MYFLWVLSVCVCVLAARSAPVNGLLTCPLFVCTDFNEAPKKKQMEESSLYYDCAHLCFARFRMALWPPKSKQWTLPQLSPLPMQPSYLRAHHNGLSLLFGAFY